MVEQIERGVALVEKVIAGLEAGTISKRALGFSDYARPPQPLAAGVAAALTTPDGRPIPESLRRFLTYDAAYLGVDTTAKTPKLKWQSYPEFIEEQFGDDEWGKMTSAFAPAFPAPCLWLPGGSGESRHFLYAGTADETGEFPVFVTDIDDQPFVGLMCAGFDHYIADLFGIVTPDPKIRHTYQVYFEDRRFAGAMERQARLNFNGFKCLDSAGCRGDRFSGTVHLDGTETCRKLWAEHYAEIDRNFDAMYESEDVDD